MEGKNRNKYLLIGFAVLLVVGLGVFYWIRSNKKPPSEETFKSGGIEPPVEKQEIRTTVNDFFAISLESNPTTGFSWEVDFNADYLELQGEEYTTHIKEQIVGAGGSEIFTFRALKQGETEIVFIYKRPWEESEEKREVHQVIIE